MSDIQLGAELSGIYDPTLTRHTPLPSGVCLSNSIHFTLENNNLHHQNTPQLDCQSLSPSQHHLWNYFIHFVLLEGYVSFILSLLNDPRLMTLI